MAEMKLNTKIKHLLVDLDGTLVGAHNVGLSVAFTAKMVHYLKRYANIYYILRAIAESFRVHGQNAKFESNQEKIVHVFARYLRMPEEKTEEVLREALMHIFPQLEQYFFPLPHAGDFINWASARFPLTLATNPVWPEEIIKMRVKWADIDPSKFRKITHAEIMHSCKPKITYYEELLKQLDLNAEDCLLIGNHMENDLAATKLGIPVYIVGPSTEITSIPLSKGEAWLGSFPQLKSALIDNGY